MLNIKTDPSAYRRRILLAVTGLSPQIVTETLYALAVEPMPGFIPTEIHLLTTIDGKKIACDALLRQEGGQFHALLADYPVLGNPAFGEQNIHIIKKTDGTSLPDIRTPEENAAAADVITALMAELTRDEQAALHVSIAGGRKTMGFYLGYAFSLYARPQDRLSHVLVSQLFESHPKFYFPPATPCQLITRDNKYIDTADAKITLADIPVVRLRHGLPKPLLNGQTGYNESVTALQESFAPPRLEIRLVERKAYCGRRKLDLTPVSLAWLAYWAKKVLEGNALQSKANFVPEDFLKLYHKLLGKTSGAYEMTQRRLSSDEEDRGRFFDENNSRLDRALKDQLGVAAAPYLLTRVVERKFITGQGKERQAFDSYKVIRRGLSLPTDAIMLEE